MEAGCDRSLRLALPGEFRLYHNFGVLPIVPVAA